MHCPTCGTPFAHAGPGSACGPAHPPPVTAADWTSANRRVTSFAAFFAAAAVAAGLLANSLADLASATADADPAAKAALALGSMIIGLLALGSMLGLLISWLFWQHAAGQLSAVYGRPRHGHAGHWGAAVLLFALVASYLVPDQLQADTSTRLAVQASLRVLGSAALIVGVAQTRGWFRRYAGLAPDPYSLVTGGDPAAPHSATPTADDWDASSWDPAVQREIERRRER